MDKQTIKEICLRHGYKLKPQADGTLDLNAYVYEAFEEVLSRVRHGQQMVNLAKATTLSDALHLIQSGIRYDSEKDLEHGLELLRSTRDELCAVPKYHDDVELVGTKQVEFNITGVPDLPRKDSVHSVPYYPLDDEEQVTIIGKADKDELDDGSLKETNDPINPNHYKTKSGVECADVADLFPYALGNAIKYIWRAGRKGKLSEDLEKCEWYINRSKAKGEIVHLKPPTQNAIIAWEKFKKVEKELPPRNAEILSQILQGNFQIVLNMLDRWISEIGDCENEVSN